MKQVTGILNSRYSIISSFSLLAKQKTCLLVNHMEEDISNKIEIHFFSYC